MIFFSLIFIGAIKSFECIFDRDCKSLLFGDVDRRFCIKNKCESILPPLHPCHRPQECASFAYYGPLACSAKCGSKSECGSLNFEKTTYCCKAVPLNGSCFPHRPKSLNGCSRSHVCLTENNISKCVEAADKSWFLGAFLSIFGNIIINLGTNLQKRSHRFPSLTVYSYPLSTMNCGILFYIIGKIASFSAYIFCNQSFLAGLSASGLISNSVMAPLINNEIFTWNDAMAIILVIIGTSTIIYNTTKTHNLYTICELLKMLKDPYNISWLFFIVASIIFLFFMINFVEINSAWRKPDQSLQILFNENYRFHENGFLMKYGMVFIYVLLSSSIASFTTLSIKILGEIVNRYLAAEGPLLTKSTLFFTVLLFGCTFGQIYWLNRAFEKFDALIVIPIFHLSWSILSIFTAGIYFQDFDNYSHVQIRNFIVGVLIIFSGSIFLGLKIKNKEVIRRRTAQSAQETQ